MKCKQNSHLFQEVHRIRNEHPEDACAVMNDRVKGSLKVTRAFGAGFLKQVWIHFTLGALQQSLWNYVCISV